MRKLSLLIVAGALLVPTITFAKPLDNLLLEKGVISGDTGTSGQLTYDKGTKLTFGNVFDAMLNLQIQNRFEIIDIDGVKTTTGFSTKRAQLILSGNMLDKQFSYRFKNDFVGGTDSGSDGAKTSALLDAWIQWNADDWAKVRVGQYKTPFSRQFNVEDYGLEFMDRSLVTNIFALNRQEGAMVSGGAEGIMYYLGLFNGQSAGEGINHPPIDTKMQGVGMLTWSTPNYGSRSVEGDINHTGDFGATVGGGVAYGEGDFSDGSSFNTTDANFDVGLRANGLALQGEFFYANLDPADDSESSDDLGFYVQGGYFMTEQLEGAVRYSRFSPDSDTSDIDDENEYAIGLGYYINGANLKLLGDIAWVVTNFADSSDVTDVRYQLELTGYL